MWHYLENIAYNFVNVSRDITPSAWRIFQPEGKDKCREFFPFFMKEELINTFRDHIRAVMGCGSQRELGFEISFMVYRLIKHGYPPHSEFIQAVQCLNCPDYHQAKIELAKLLTIELSLIKIRASLGS